MGDRSKWNFAGNLFNLVIYMSFINNTFQRSKNSNYSAQSSFQNPTRNNQNENSLIKTLKIAALISSVKGVAAAISTLKWSFNLYTEIKNLIPFVIGGILFFYAKIKKVALNNQEKAARELEKFIKTYEEDALKEIDSDTKIENSLREKLKIIIKKIDKKDFKDQAQIFDFYLRFPILLRYGSGRVFNKISPAFVSLFVKDQNELHSLTSTLEKYSIDDYLVKKKYFNRFSKQDIIQSIFQNINKEELENGIIKNIENAKNSLKAHLNMDPNEKFELCQLKNAEKSQNQINLLKKLFDESYQFFLNKGSASPIRHHKNSSNNSSQKKNI